MRAIEPAPLSIVTRLRGDAAIYGLTTVLARGTTFLLVPILTRLLAPDEIGLVEYAVIAIGFANVVVAVEISQALARYIPDPEYLLARKQIASTALWFTATAYAVASFAAILIGGALLPPDLRYVVPFIVAAGASTGMFLLIQGQLRWELRPRPYAIASVTYAVVSVAATWVLVANGHGIRGVLIGQTAGALVGLGVALSGARGTYEASFNRGWLVRLVQFSGPLVPASIGTLLALYVDRLVIGAVLSLDDVAQFSVGYRVSSVVAVLMTAVQLALAPLIYAGHRRPDAPGEIAESFRLVMGLALSAWLLIALSAPEIIRLVATDSYSAGGAVIPLQVPAVILSGALVFAPGLGIVTRTAPIAAISILGAFMNTLLNLLLVPALGISGAAMATLVTSAMVFGVMMWQSQRHYPIPYHFRRMAVGAGIVIGAIVATGVAVQAPIPFWGRVVVAGIALFAMAVAGVIEPGRWLQSARTKKPAV